MYSARETVIPMPIARAASHASKGMALSRSQVAAAVAWKVRKLAYWLWLCSLWMDTWNEKAES